MTTRPERVYLRITAAEALLLAEQARLAGITLSDWVRIRLGLAPSNKRRNHEGKALPSPTN